MAQIKYLDSRRIMGASNDTVQDNYFEDSYTSNSGWTQSGSTITVNSGVSGKVHWNSTSSTGTDYVWKSLGMTLSDTEWVARFEYKRTAGTSCCERFHVFALSSASTHIGSNSQDMLGFGVNNTDVSTDFYCIYKDGATFGESSSTVDISTSTQYYIELARTSSTNLRLKVFSDSAYTTQVGSTVNYTVPATVTSLSYLHHSSANNAYGVVISGELDNTKIWNQTTTPFTVTYKPTNVETNSIFVETDTAYRYWFNGSSWINPDGAGGEPVRGVYAGGSEASSVNTMEYITIASTGNATDFGDLTDTSNIGGGCSNRNRGCHSLGNDSIAPSNVINYITIGTTGNALDFGDLTVARNNCGACASDTRGCWGGGDTGSDSNVIDYITIASTGNAIDFGDLSVTRRATTALSDWTTRGMWACGANENTVIDYITIATTGNATDFGDLTVARRSGTAVASETRGVIGGGANASHSPQNVMDYITIATTGNATDFGDMTISAQQRCGVSSYTRGCFGGGTASTNVIDYITIATTGNATDFGDLSASRAGMALTGMSGGG